MKHVLVIVPDGVELFDLSGPIQVFHEATLLSDDAYTLSYASPDGAITSAQGLPFGQLAPLPSTLPPQSMVLVPAARKYREREYWQTENGQAFRHFLRRAHMSGAHIASICVGSFALGEAGLLAGVECTTHWKRVEMMRERFPQAQVRDNCLYVIAERVSTSAGVASGVDLALAFVERDCGSRIAAAVARELVVPVRRSGSDSQLSPYFARRDHTYHDVHLVQDWVLEHAGERFTLDDLARVASMSVRTLTRQFRAATGTTVKEYVTSVRLERSRQLLREERLTVDDIADRCGFGDARQLRRLWQSAFGTSPSAYRAHTLGLAS